MRTGREILGEAGGFTLVELLLASVLAIAVITAAVNVFIADLHTEPGLEARGQAIQQARVTMEGVVRELREGAGIVSGTTPTASRLSIATYVDSTCSGVAATTATLCGVTYSCSSGACTRQVAPLPGNGGSAGPVVRVVSGLSSNNIFSCTPSCSAPTYIGVTLPFAGPNGGSAITLNDGAALRNVGSS